MTIAIVIQARTGSTRLPGKVLLPLAGEPLLARMLARVEAARHARHVIVATTVEAADAPIVELCRRLGVTCFRGDPEDCLDRHYRAGLSAGATAVVKIPSDCPLIDPDTIDAVLDVWVRSPERWDYLSNLHPPSWPDGQDVEVMPMRALELAVREARARFDREHTTPFFWSQPERFRLGNVRWSTGEDCSRSERWVVDWYEDYLFVGQVFERLLPEHGPRFGVPAVRALLARHPELRRINACRYGYDYTATRAQERSAWE